MQTNSSDFPQELTHPETGERMVLDTSQGSDVTQHRLERNIGIAAGGQEVLAKIRAKEQTAGRIYVNPLTGYRARLLPDGGQAATGDQADGQASGASSPAPAPVDREERRRQLQRELADLDR